MAEAQIGINPKTLNDMREREAALIRGEALDKSVRVSLSQSGTEKTETIVERAVAFEKFLRGNT